MLGWWEDLLWQHCQHPALPLGAPWPGPGSRQLLGATAVLRALAGSYC